MKLDRRLLRAARTQTASLVLTIGLGLAAGVLTVMQARMLSRVISQVFLENRSFQEVPGLLFSLLALIALRAVLAWGSDASAGALAVRIKTALRQRLFGHLIALGPIQLNSDQSQTGELTGVLNEGLDALDAYFSQYLPQLVLAVCVPLAVLVFILPLDLLSAIILVLTAPLIPVFLLLIGNLAEALTRRQWLALRRIGAYFLDIIQGLTTLKSLGRSRGQIQMIRKVSDQYRETTMGVLRVTFLSALVLELVTTISTALVAVQVGLRLLYGQGGLSFEEAFFILVLAPEFYLPLRTLGARFHAGMAGAAAAERIYEILETPVISEKPTENRRQFREDSRRIVASSLPFPVTFKNVSYRYPDGRAALNDVSFQLMPGCKTALVGPSGAGKSTVAHLLLRFVAPQSGSIWIGDVGIESLSPGAWRRSVAWVPQNPILFNGTVAENIRLGQPEASLEEVKEAARQAGAHDFILALPEGYETGIGERGTRLSGGQAQRIAVARAFLKNAPILILDEATSNLDPESEDLLQAAIARLARQRTVLIIAHRMRSVQDADQILVLEDGCLREEGTHASLLAQGGLYRRLVGRAGMGQLPSEIKDEAPLSLLYSPSVDSRGFVPVPSPVGEEQVSRAKSATLLRLIGLAAPFAGRIALSVLLGFATVGSGIGLMATSAYMVAKAALQPSIAELQVAIVGVRFFGLGRGVFRYLDRYLSHDITLRLLARWRAWFYEALEPLAPARLMSLHSGDLLSRIVGDIASLESFYVRALAPPLVAVLTALATGIFLAAYDVRLAGINLLCMALLGAGIPALMYYAGRTPGSQLARLRAGLSSAVVEGIQGLADLLAYGQEKRQAARVEALGRDLAAVQLRLGGLLALQNAAGGLLAGLGMWAVLVLAISLVSDGRMEGVLLPVIVLAALASFEAVLPLPLAAQSLEVHLEAARRLFAIVDAEPAVREPAAPAPVPEKFGLEVRNLRFRYPPSSPAALSEEEGGASFSRRERARVRERIPPLPPQENYALEGISFSLPPGGRLAVVGPSGAGKSTLIHLLLRFWEYEEGEIRLDGRDLRNYASDDLRRRIAVVAQNTYLFAATVRENLLIAQPRASEADLVRAASAAQIDDFLQVLPQGYDTWIGEGGLRLSAGQRQRLAIARALLQDAPLLILDEATANLDPVTERQVIETLYAAMQGRTVFAVTHRLVGLEAMDEILVLRAGEVAERGRHTELLKQRGLYCRMWELQNQIV